MKDQKLLPTSIVAKRLGKNSRWVRNVILCGELEAYNLSSGHKKARYYVAEHEIERYLNERRVD